MISTINRSRYLTTVAVLVICLLLGSSGLAEAGLGDVQISGTVTDRAGSPLVGVRINDGMKSVYSDANGAFSISEPAGSSIHLSASKNGLVTGFFDGIALPTTVANFELFYNLVTTMSPSAFSNTMPTTIQITARTFAPSSACLTWTDVSTNTTVALQRDQGQSGPEYVWLGSYQVPAGTPDSNYANRTIATVCDSPVALTESITSSYFVDSMGPVFEVISPLADGNSLPLNPQIVIRMSDPSATGGTGSGVASVEAKLVDRSTGSISSLQLTMSGDIARANTSLSAGHTYQVDVAGTDRAGNVSTSSSRFRALSSITATTPDWIKVEPTPYTSKTEGTILDTYVWEDVDATIAPFVVDVDRSLHPGSGHVDIDFSVPSGSIRYTLAGVPQAGNIKGVTSKTIQATFVSDRAGAVVVLVPQQLSGMGSVTADLPKGAKDVTLSMETAPTQNPTFPTCIDPSSNGTPCSTDPINAHSSTRGVWQSPGGASVLLRVPSYEKDVQPGAAAVLTKFRSQPVPQDLIVAPDPDPSQVDFTDLSVAEGSEIVARVPLWNSQTPSSRTVMAASGQAVVLDMYGTGDDLTAVASLIPTTPTSNATTMIHARTARAVTQASGDILITYTRGDGSPGSFEVAASGNPNCNHHCTASGLIVGTLAFGVCAIPGVNLLGCAVASGAAWAIGQECGKSQEECYRSVHQGDIILDRFSCDYDSCEMYFVARRVVRPGVTLNNSSDRSPWMKGFWHRDTPGTCPPIFGSGRCDYSSYSYSLTVTGQRTETMVTGDTVQFTDLYVNAQGGPPCYVDNTNRLEFIAGVSWSDGYGTCNTCGNNYNKGTGVWGGEERPKVFRSCDY